jgi:hypothetical protein
MNFSKFNYDIVRNYKKEIQVNYLLYFQILLSISSTSKKALCIQRRNEFHNILFVSIEPSHILKK